MKKKKYYSLVKNKNKKEATLTIFGDITSYPYLDSDVSNYSLAKQLSQINDVETINVRINSYGGEVAEGLAIYNALKSHTAKIKTFCDGFACSIASVIFMAGDERIMSKSSFLMIHNAWSWATGNAKELRKQADDLDKITQASINAYMEHVSINEGELKELLDKESWLDYEEAIQKGFATSVREDEDNSKASQSVKQALVNMILASQEQNMKADEDNQKGGNVMIQYECSECGYVHEGELPEFFICPECGADKDSFVEIEEAEFDDDVLEEIDNENSENLDNADDQMVDKNDEEKQDKVTNEKVVAFFSSIMKGMKDND